MTYNFNFNIEKDGQPYVTNDKASKFIADLLYSRISDKAVLEARIAKALLDTHEIELNQDDAQYLLDIILNIPYDNYFKVALAAPLLVEEYDGVPVEVTLWQLRGALEVRDNEEGERVERLLTFYHPEQLVIGIGAAIGLTQEQALSYNLREWISHLINIMPVSTSAERSAKSAAFNAFEYANTILRTSPTVNQLGAFLQLTKQNIDDIFIFAKNKIEA